MTELQFLYPWLRLLHILLVVVAVGFNISYSVWLARARREPHHYGYVLRGIKVLDDRFANPAYGLLLVTGLAMVVIGGLELTRPWLAISLALYLALIVIGLFLYSPILRRQIASFEAGGPDSAELQELDKQGRWVGIVLGILVLVILALMVLKPGAVPPRIV
jgi:uncharacterized membrane protein